MSTKDRLNIFPSRANLVLVKGRMAAATKGLSLLKRKRDALDVKMREFSAQRKNIEHSTKELMAVALFSMAKGHFLDTDFKPAPIICTLKADAYMNLTYTRTMGLQLPIFEPVIKKSTSLPLTGLSRGGAHVETIRQNFQDALRNYLSLASIDYSMQVLKDGLRATNMRMNGLEFVVIPRLSQTIIYIRDELDEFEREEFYRLKCSQSKQRSKRKDGQSAKASTSDGLDKEVQTYITGRYPSNDSFSWFTAMMASRETASRDLASREMATQYPSFLFSIESASALCQESGASLNKK